MAADKAALPMVGLSSLGQYVFYSLSAMLQKTIGKGPTTVFLYEGVVASLPGHYGESSHEPIADRAGKEEIKTVASHRGAFIDTSLS
jgi:hypothetical protein